MGVTRVETEGRKDRMKFLEQVDIYSYRTTLIYTMITTQLISAVHKSWDINLIP